MADKGTEIINVPFESLKNKQTYSENIQSFSIVIFLKVRFFIMFLM